MTVQVIQLPNSNTVTTTGTIGTYAGGKNISGGASSLTPITFPNVPNFFHATHVKFSVTGTNVTSGALFNLHLFGQPIVPVGSPGDGSNFAGSVIDANYLGTIPIDLTTGSQIFGGFGPLPGPDISKISPVDVSPREDTPLIPIIADAFNQVYGLITTQSTASWTPGGTTTFIMSLIGYQ